MHLIIAALFLILAACGDGNTGGSSGGGNPTAPTSQPVQVSLALEVFRPTSGALVPALPLGIHHVRTWQLEAASPAQDRRLGVRATAAATGGSALGTISCIATHALSLDVGMIPPLGEFTFGGASGNRTLSDLTLIRFADPAPSSDGKVECALNGTDERSLTFRLVRDIQWNPQFHTAPATSSCAPDAETMCLINSRFKVTLKWFDEPASGPARVASPRFNDGGIFILPGLAAAVDSQVSYRLFDRCAQSGRYEAQVSSNTPLRFDLTQWDTATGRSLPISGRRSEPPSTIVVGSFSCTIQAQ